METEKKLDIEYYKNELEVAIRNLQTARNEIEYLQKENIELVARANQERQNKRVVIETEKEIKSIDIYFE